VVTAPRRGEVWWADLPVPRGSEPGHRRPVLIVQSNPFNDSRIQTIVVAAITSNIRLAEAPGNVRLRPADSGLPKPSVVNVSQLLTLSREFLAERAGTLPGAAMNRVADGLRLVLAL
jgi:mRNA interferase MazF